tara:strand:+ start:647 stop:1522 length:876 start_codon:yes stop_codon:yes gene_type:complete
MASEIRVNKIENRSGLGTVTFADTGVDLAGIVTATTFSGSGASLTALPAAQLSGTLPAISGANLTNLTATNLTGTIADARFPATLPAASAANLTNVPAANITGTLPALTAANLTNIPAANLVGVCTSGLTKTGGFGKVLKVQQTTIPTLGTYSTGSTTYQTVQESTFVVVGTNSNLLIMLNIMGYNSGSNVDRNFRLAYKVASGSYTNINFNPNGTVSENMFSDIRGSGPSYEIAVNTQFLIDGTWNAGDTITVKLETVGESSFYLNGAISSTDVRFGNGLSKFIFTEYSD